MNFEEKKLMKTTIENTFSNSKSSENLKIKNLSRKNKRKSVSFCDVPSIV